MIPKLSIIVIGFRMARQLQNTLYSLSADYQRNIHIDDYEIIVVENNSDETLDPIVLDQLGDNFHYYLREEKSHSPVYAVKFAMEKCRGKTIGLIIDGARMLTPRVLEYVLLAQQFSDQAVVAVPGYHLGDVDQKESAQAGHDQVVEEKMLEDIQWRDNGYRLFDIACWSSGNKRGYLQPLMECSALFCNADTLRSTGAVDERFQQVGGGSINLHIYRKMGITLDSRLFVLSGEGSFHQYHGGVTTSEADDRDVMLKEFRDFTDAIWDGKFQALRREPIQLGAVTKEAQRFLLSASEFAEMRFNRLTSNGVDFWQDDQLVDSSAGECRTHQVK